MNLSSPRKAGPRRWTEGQHSPHAGSISPGQSAINQWDWGFHTLRGGIDPADVRLRLQDFWVVDMWATFSPGNRDLSSTCAAGPRRWTEGQHSPRAGSMNPGKIAITKWDLGLHTLRDSIDPGNMGFLHPGFLSCRDIEGFLIRGWKLTLSECGKSSALPRGTTLAAHWLHEP